MRYAVSIIVVMIWSVCCCSWYTAPHDYAALELFLSSTALGTGTIGTTTDERGVATLHAQSKQRPVIVGSRRASD
jgi:hypothetical protein